MSCSIEPKMIIEKLRNYYRNKDNPPFTDDELRSFCIASLYEKLRVEVKNGDFDLVRWMLNHSNYHLANLGQALLRPFIERFDKKDELKPFLINLWESTENDSLKSGLLFDLFLYSEDELSSEFVNKAFTYLEEKNCAFSQMLEEWLEGKEKILNVIRKHLSKNKDNLLKTALWLFSLISVSHDKLEEAKKILDTYRKESNPLIARTIDFADREVMRLQKRSELSDDIAQKWWDYLVDLRDIIREGAESVFSEDNVKLKIFLNVRNRHLSYQPPGNKDGKIPQLQWRYAGLGDKDIENSFEKEKEIVIKFFSVELFGGGFLSPSFFVEDYIKLIPLKDYFSITDSIDTTNEERLYKFIQEFNSSKEDKFNSKHPRSDKEENYLRQILACKLNKFFPDIGRNEEERWEKILRLVERKTLFNENEIEKGISIMLAVTFGTYYPMDIFVTLIPKNNNSNNLAEKLKGAVEDYYNKNSGKKGEAVSFWKLELGEPYKAKIILLERALSQVVMHLFTKIYALYFQHLIAEGKENVIKQGLSVMLSVPAENIIVSSTASPEDEDQQLTVPYDNTKYIYLPYPSKLDAGGSYKKITQFKVKELLTKLDEYYTNILNEQKKLKMKDAVVAIMGRNMSHNIGSHVLWHLGEDLTLDPEKLKETQTKIKNFYSYLRERMGFIALIATERPSWAVERLLKTAVDHFSEMDLLQNSIVLTEKLIKNGKEYRFNPIVQLDSKSNERLIEFPHGSYGEQALYIILENIIRNTIKHNRNKFFNGSNGDIPINFVLSVTEPDKSDWKRDYWKVTIRDDLKEYSESLEELVKKLQEKADENIFDDLGKRKRTNLGFKEKRVCAAFLRMIPQEEIDSAELKSKISEEKIPPLLTIDKWENNGKEHLAHIIYLRKPKKALLISEDKGLLNNNNIQLLEDKGFYITHKDEAKTLLNTDTMTYKFLVLMLDDKSWAENFVKEHYIKLPYRILSTNPLSTNRPYQSISYDAIKLNLSKPDALYSLFWEKWLNYFGNRKEKVYIIESSKMNSLKYIPPKYQVVDNQFNNYNESSIILSHDKQIGSDFFNKVFACEGYSGIEGVGGLIEMLSKPEFSYLYEQLLESFLWEIVVIDERIFDKKDIMKTPPKFEIKLSVETLWNKRMVRILNPEKFIEGEWDEIDKPHKPHKPHILILHQGVIDKYNESHKGEKAFENRWKKEIKEQIPYLVIDSDRGKPDSVERLGAVWIQFSDLGDIMVHKAENSLSKYLLVDILTSLRGGKGR